MTKTPGSEDPELRNLLDSIGLRATHVPASPTQDLLDQARAQRDLDAITSKRHIPKRRIRRWCGRGAIGLVMAAAIALVCYLVLPSTSTPAAAQTPPMLSFSGAEKTTAGGLHGVPAANTLAELAAHAAAQNPPADLPVQRIEQYAWWAATESEHGTTTTTVLVPVERTTYLLPNGKMRDIEHRGEPLDRHGQISRATGSWQSSPRAADETFDTGQPANYPETLPTDPAKLVRALAPRNGCADARGDCLLNALANIYTTYVVAPSVSQALWRATARLPDIETLGTTTDRLGRHAIALTAPAPSTGQQIIVLADPQTGSVLGSETILTKPNKDFTFSPPAVVAFTALLDSQRVAAKES
ncbi:MAG: CU044_5270 family protein [Nocardioides sp.]|uniref:CU044_5270 family protein n=1 Tax=Nocardioides sp. TaxID=35761 RepID=UPI0039E5E192